MNSDTPKVLHELGGVPLFAHALRAAASLAPERIVLVTGYGSEAVSKAARAFDDTITIAVQEEQNGTAHAVAQAAPALEGFDGDAVVLYGDTPFISPETIAAMTEARASGADVVVLGFEAADPGRYGRLVVEDGALTRIVEFKDATEAERAITLCNSGVVAADAATLFALIAPVASPPWL